MKVAWITPALLLIATLAWGQVANQQGAKGLVFGQGAIPTGLAKPTNGQGVCNVNGQLGPCGGYVVSTITSGSTITITSDGTSSIQLEYVILSATVTTINGPAANTLPDGKIILVVFEQPVGGFAYGIPTCITSPGGYQVNVADTGVGSSPSGHIGACPSPGALPGMSTADLANLELDLHYRATQPAGGLPELVVISAARH